MNEDKKIAEIKKILNSVFKIDLEYASKHRIKKIECAILRVQSRIAVMRNSYDIYNYLIERVNGTPSSIIFSAYLKEKQLPRIEDVIDKIEAVVYS